MALDIYKINPEFRDIMPQEIIDLEESDLGIYYDQTAWY